jgi:invasion protein IalB
MYRLVVAVFGFLAAFAATDPGRAAQNAPSQDKPAEQVQLSYSAWTRSCTREADVNGKRICFVTKTGRIDSGQLAITAIIVERDGESGRTLRVMVPLGMQTVHGTRVIVDSNPPVQNAYVFCAADGCVSDYELTPDLLGQLRKGDNLVVQAINSNGAPLTLPLPLFDFKPAFNGSGTDWNSLDGEQRRILTSLFRIGDEAGQADFSPPLICSPWTKVCLKGQEANAKQVCFTGKDGRIESGQPEIAAVVIEPEGDAKKLLRVTLPVGVQLAMGTRVTIDGNAPMQSAYVVCFANGCMSDYEVTPGLTSNLRNGRNLTVQAIQNTGRTLTLSLPLADFAKAYSGPPTDPKAFEEMQKKLQDELAQRARNNPAVAAVKPPEPISPVAPPASSAPVALGRRVALVIGNSTYKYMPMLRNPKNDAIDVESTLKGLGFETVLATDLDRVGMNAAVSRFSRIVNGADVAIVYYSGHGMQFAGKNYLLPTDANLESAADVNRFQLMPFDDLVDLLGSAKGLQLIILDACRSNPIERDFKNKIASAAGGDRDAGSTRGFSRIQARSGLLVTYATAANEVAADGDGRNSPFTKAFLKNVVTPDLEIRQMLYHVQSDVYTSTDSRQLPEISSLYVGPDIRLKPSR